MHMPTVVGTLKPRYLPEFKWVKTVLGNLKTTLAGAFHSLNYRKYAGHYLAAFACRFNRRFDLRGLVARLIVDVALSKPAKETVADRRLRQVSNQEFPTRQLLPLSGPSHADKRAPVTAPYSNALASWRRIDGSTVRPGHPDRFATTRLPSSSMPPRVSVRDG